MTLKDELGLKKGFEVLSHEAILNIYYTASCIKKEADQFFSKFGLTDVQFNVLMLLHHQSRHEKGLSQSELSRMMLVNRANVTSLVDRMEQAGLVLRTSASRDRRCNIIKMTTRGRRLFARVEPLYAKQIKKIMAPAGSTEQKKLITALGKIRSRLTEQS